jgi:serine/threonine-protein kinase SRPK3
LKVLRTDSTKAPNQPDEADLVHFVNAANPQHPGPHHIVQLLDHFIHSGPNGDHSCLVFEPLGESVLSLQKRSEHGSLPLNNVKMIARQVLLALDYLHSYCNLIHTGLKF